MRVTRTRASASGYILDEARNFSLDVAAGAVHGRRPADEPLDPRAGQAARGDIYVPSALLARWLPVDLDSSTWPA